MSTGDSATIESAETQQAVRTGISLRVVSETAEFSNLEKDWDLLTDQCPDCDIFVTWAWQYGWWQEFGDDYELRIYTARNSTGHLVGVLPCYLSRSRAFSLVDYYELHFIGANEMFQPDYLDLIARPRDRAIVTSAIIPHLLGESAVWDVLTFDNMPAESPLTRRLPREMPGHQFIGERSESAIIELPPEWSLYLDSLDKKDREELQFSRERFSFQKELKYRQLSDRESVLAAVRVMAGLETKSQRVNKPLGDFYNALADELLDRNQIRLHCMMRGDDFVAVLFCLSWRGTVYACASGISPDIKHLDPLQLLFSFMIEDAIASEAARCDFLSGDYSSKKALARQVRETVTIGAFRNSRAGSLVRFRRRMGLGFPGFFKS